MNIRSATEADYDAIAEVHTESWRDSYKGILPDDYLSEQAAVDLRARWDDVDITPEDCVLVAEEDGKITGFIVVWGRPSPFIDNLHVRPSIRSGGVGAKLMCAAAAKLQSDGQTTAYLWVMADNPRARAFYERLGGVVTGEEEKDIFGNKALNYKIEWPDISVISQH
ncbi:MAG: N-acetyltransferase [Hyphococcus sp.]|nr:MAG: N-acetyltransferase [Marinicaulis sp.]